MKGKLENFFKNPAFFILRQIYKLLVVFPYQLFVGLFIGKKIPGTEETEIVFLVTSIIYPRYDKNVSYDAPRSIFLPEERAEHTIGTIQSIRKKVPSAKIVLIESGLQKELPCNLKERVDQYIYIGDRRLVRRAVDSKNKSTGEAVMLLTGQRSLRWKADRYFKISGRYFLTDDFNLQDWDKDKFVFAQLRDDYYQTRLYGFGRDNFLLWKEVLLRGLPLNFIDYAIEHTLARYLPKNIVKILPKLGVSGLTASAKERTVMND